ncbi:MAG: uroporphyrinogen decarboxylase family protein [Thermoguttaceae bacterium]
MDFSPSVYEHAAYLIGRTPWDVSRDADLLFEAHAEAFRRYAHRPIVVGIDIYNLEAEAYGATVDRPHGAGIPSIGKPICTSASELSELKPFDPATAGRLAMVIEVAGRLARAFPEADVRVPLSGPFSIAGNLVGLETLLCEAIQDPDRVTDGLRRLVDGQLGFCEAIHRAGVGIALFESAAAPPLLSPEMFRAIELPSLGAMTVLCASGVVRDAIPCILGGDTAPILEALLETGTRYVVCPIETDQEAFMKIIWDRTNVRVRVNTSSQVLVHGTRDELCREVERIRRLTAGRENVCLGTGALPYDTPPENVLWLKSLCPG